MHIHHVIFVMLSLLVPLSSSAETVIVSNRDPRRDTDGNIIDAHDGRLIKFGDMYYIYGTVYGNTNGMSGANYYTCYSSPDLEQWTKHEKLIPELGQVQRYRPHVVYHRKNKKYVLFYDWLDGGFGDSKIGVATSDTPVGPFVVQNPSISMQNTALGDFNIMIDYDNTAYITYNITRATADAIAHSPFIERLTEDYLDGAGGPATHIEIPHGNEAAIFFKREGIYYFMVGHTCCFCSQGTGAKVFAAPHPLGPYTYQNNINVVNGDSISMDFIPAPGAVPGTGRPDRIIGAQETMMAEIPVKTGMAYLWMGDRWFSAPDGDGGTYTCGNDFPGTKGHDFQYWSPPVELKPDLKLKNLEKFVDNFQLDLRDSADVYNVAAYSEGSEAAASSAASDKFPVSAIINGEIRGLNWEHHGGGWSDGTENDFPDWAQVDFEGLRSIHRITLYTLQDNYTDTLDVNQDLTFTKYGIQDFDVQYWDTTGWRTVPGGSVKDNNKVRRQFDFPLLTTDKIRVTVNRALQGHSRIVELEAWGHLPTKGCTNPAYAEYNSTAGIDDGSCITGIDVPRLKYNFPELKDFSGGFTVYNPDGMPYKIIITDVHGVIIKKIKTKESRNFKNENFKPGIYFVSVDMDNKVRTHTLWITNW